MDILLKRATIIAPGDKNHLQTKDILVSKGKIEKIANTISAPKAKVIESENLHVSIGWMDIGTHIGEPGLEHRETIRSAANAAAAGGYTDIAVMPTVDPVTHSKSQVSYIANNQPSNGVQIHSIAAVSRDAKGEDLTMPKLKYTESELVLHCISSGESCDLIKKAIKDDVNVTATVSYLNLIHTDEDLRTFNSNLKVKPPLRSNEDRKALIKGVRKGSIQSIVSNHVPLEEEQKKLEFSYAGFGNDQKRTNYDKFQ